MGQQRALGKAPKHLKGRLRECVRLLVSQESEMEIGKDNLFLDADLLVFEKAPTKALKKGISFLMLFLLNTNCV